MQGKVQSERKKGNKVASKGKSYSWLSNDKVRPKRIKVVIRALIN